MKTLRYVTRKPAKANQLPELPNFLRNPGLFGFNILGDFVIWLALLFANLPVIGFDVFGGGGPRFNTGQDNHE